MNPRFKVSTIILLTLVALSLLLVSQGSWAQIGQFGPDPPPRPGSLKIVTVPVPANLGNYVVNQQAAIILGKPLFWEEQVGCSGIASTQVTVAAVSAPPSLAPRTDTVMTSQRPICIACAPNWYAATLFATQLDPIITTVTVTSGEGGSATSPITRNQ